MKIRTIRHGKFVRHSDKNLLNIQTLQGLCLKVGHKLGAPSKEACQLRSWGGNYEQITKQITTKEFITII